MMRDVHYMVRKPGVVGEVIYPSEIDQTEDYYGVGVFYLPGNGEDDVEETYSFWAIREGRAIETRLNRRSSGTFLAIVDGIGSFGFKARRVGSPVKYGGSLLPLDEKFLIRQLAPFDNYELDQAVRKFDFYFVGFTPKLDMKR